MAHKKYGSSHAVKPKFYKCKACYSSGRFCQHAGQRKQGKYSKYSKYSKGGVGVKRSYRMSGYGKKRSTMSSKKSADLEKIEIPVLDAEMKPLIDDVPLNGVRVRGFRISDVGIMRSEAKKFAGRVCWRGVSEKFDFEMNGAGPFMHRRVMFTSTQEWSFRPAKLLKPAIPSNVWGRHSTSSLTDAHMANDLRRLFGEDTNVRGLLFSPVVANGVTIVEDSRQQYEGKDTGARRSKKYWNGFGKNKNGSVLKYTLSDGGQVTSNVADDSPGQNIYVLDVFQYGINGLDMKVPCREDIGKKRPSDASVLGGVKKRHKSDESVDSRMEGMTFSEYELTGNSADDLAGIEAPVRGIVRVISSMKLYWYDPK